MQNVFNREPKKQSSSSMNHKEDDVPFLDDQEQQQVIQEFETQHRKHALQFRIAFGILCGFWALFYFYHALYHYSEPWGTRMLTEFRSQTSDSGQELVRWSLLSSFACCMSAVGLLGNVILMYTKLKKDDVWSRNFQICVTFGLFLNIANVIWWGSLTVLLITKQRRYEMSDIILPVLWTATPVCMSLMAWGCEASLNSTAKEIDELKRSTYHFKKL
eukprot:TRINITY_DN5400_c0_g3_i1.p2 TRINITY_DN5400_c0_g3~~TRINITY_DN5400_c0_g3_i1.p2  ORF type:complete len:230 (+),score=12.36 TRINITY_DN5400_c0_g3_i1:42-692(+)